MKQPGVRKVARWAILAAVYFSSAKLGFMLAGTTDMVTSVWPPTGIAMAAVALFGYKVWPGIALGAFLANFTSGGGVAPAVAIATGNTLEAVAAVYLLKKHFNFKPAMSTLRDVMALFLVAPAATALSASIGTSTLAHSGVIAWSAYNDVWLTWWIGDLYGALFIAPLILVLFSRSTFPGIIFKRRAEAVALLASAVAVGYMVFFRDPNPGLPRLLAGSLIYPVLLWAALRLGQAGAMVTAFAITLLAILGTASGLGPFVVGGFIDLNLTRLQFFIFVLSATALVVSTLAETSQRTQEALRQQAKEMEDLLEQNRQMEEQLRESNKRATGILTRILEESIEPLPLEEHNGSKHV